MPTYEVQHVDGPSSVLVEVCQIEAPSEPAAWRAFKAANPGREILRLYEAEPAESA